MEQNFTMISKDELNINGNISYISIINKENILNIIFMSENQNNYRAYMYDISNFSFISESIIPDDTLTTPSYSSSSSYLINSYDENFETNSPTQLEEILDNIDYLRKYYYKTKENNGIDFEIKDNNVLYNISLNNQYYLVFLQVELGNLFQNFHHMNL